MEWLCGGGGKGAASVGSDGRRSGGTVTSAEQGPAKSSRNPRKDGGLAMVAD